MNNEMMNDAILYQIDAIEQALGNVDASIKTKIDNARSFANPQDMLAEVNAAVVRAFYTEAFVRMKSVANLCVGLESLVNNTRLS